MPAQTTIQVRRGTASSWTSTNPTLAAGEVGFETDTGKFKIGTGSATWSSLTYFNPGSLLTSPLTTKGDLWTYSTTNDRLPVGSDGSILVANSAASTGLGYTPYFVAGKNKIINGDFGIWQRGTSFTLTTATDTYCADRFVFTASGSSTAATVSQQTFTAGTAPVAGYEGTYFARLTNFATPTSFQIRQKIEDVRTFAGQTVTFSFWVKGNGALSSITAEAAQYFGSGGSSAVSAGSGTFSVTTSWVRQSFTFTIPSVAGKTIGAGSYFEVSFYKSGSVTASQQIDIWGWQLESGSVATPFTTATGTIQGELAACQRYYWRQTAGTAYGAFGQGLATSTIDARIYLQNPVPMRVLATSVDFANLFLSDAVGGSAITTCTLANNNQLISAVDVGGATGLTSYRTYALTGNNNTAGYIGFSAEL